MRAHVDRSALHSRTLIGPVPRVSDETSPLVLAQLVEEAELPPSQVHTTWAELRASRLSGQRNKAPVFCWDSWHCGIEKEGQSAGIG